MLASKYRVLYTGISSDLKVRVWQHKQKVFQGFSNKYNVDRLVWYEAHDDPTPAIEREKQIKRWGRAKKIRLIERMNPEWRDLSDEL